MKDWACGPSPLSRGRFSRIALVAETSADARDVVVEGESGILAIHQKDYRPVYEPSKRRLTWPNGAIATCYNATEPDQLRGPQHDAAWSDELAKWRYLRDTWDMLQFGLRLGEFPRQVITTTPRPIAVLKEIMEQPGTIITRGSTDENRANLAPSFLQQIIGRYAGTRLGRQELEAEILDDAPGALWNRDQLEKLRVKDYPDLERIVVAIDPAVTSGEESDETGIIVAGKDHKGHGYVLEDLSGRYAPIEWAQIAVKAYHRHEADRIVAEVNNGGDMVEATIRMVDVNISYAAVRATRGKVVRAEPVSALYEQNRIHHVGSLPALEDQMCQFTTDFDSKLAGYSPDHVDAMVWAFFDLLVDTGGAEGWLAYMAAQAANTKKVA